MVLIAVILGGVFALLPLLRLWSQGRSAQAAGGLCVAVAVASVVLATRWAPAPERPRQDRPIEVLAQGHVGSATCRSCHPGEHASWYGSFHRTMTQQASRVTVLPQFERLELDWFGQPVMLEWRGEQLWTRFVRGGGRPGPVERPIEQLTGSHHMQVFWYSTGVDRELAPVPVCYKIEEGLWIPLTSVFVVPPELRDPPDPGKWNQSCAMCHTTDPRPRMDIGRTDTHVGEFGISCEACHGPGEAHVAANRSPVRRLLQRGEGSDDTIVNPATLRPARSAEVCGHCHSVRILKQRHFDAWREHGSPFVPGNDLQSSHLVIDVDDGDAPELRQQLRQNPDFFASSFWPDGQVRLSGREFSGLRDSPCYQHGDASRQIDCTSCHVMHHADGSADDAWRDDQLGLGMRGNRACTQCHQQLADEQQLQQHTRHAPGSSGSNCYDCHMTFTSIGLMKASRSHAITVPSVQSELATGRPNACNQCHLDRSLGWTADQLADGWGIAAPQLDAEQREVAASVRWLLTGDAGLRMLAAWSYGWSDAQQASGTDWMAPYLSRLLDDPYYVVRFNAARSLRSIGGYGGVLKGYDYVAGDAAVKPFVDSVRSVWQARYTGGARANVLMGPRGLDVDRFRRLYARRDDRMVFIHE
ncbi:MAG: multiheme c-type cytochrome [Planctomycetota bacterium]